MSQFIDIWQLNVAYLGRLQPSFAVISCNYHCWFMSYLVGPPIILFGGWYSFLPISWQGRLCWSQFHSFHGALGKVPWHGKASTNGCDVMWCCFPFHSSYSSSLSLSFFPLALTMTSVIFLGDPISIQRESFFFLYFSIIFPTIPWVY